MILYEGLRDRLFDVQGDWNFRKCQNPECHSIWLDPKPLASDLSAVYGNYYTHADTGNGCATDTQTSERSCLTRQTVRGLEKAWLTLLLLRSQRRSIDVMFLNDRDPGRLLEIGCGDGQRLKTMRELGWNVEGQEIDSIAADTASRTTGALIHVGDLVSLALPAGSYDAIVMNHVIEHAYDPIALLKECWRLLKPGGVFVATTPNIDSYGHKRFGAAWHQLEPPRHLQLFTAKSLDRIAERSGFANRRVWSTPARAGGLLAASVDVRRTGRHRMRGPITTSQILSAFWYQLIAKLAHMRRPNSGEEIVLLARK